VVIVRRAQFWTLVVIAMTLLSGCARPVPLYPRVQVESAHAEMWLIHDGRQDVVVYLTLVNKGGQSDRLLGGRSDLAERVGLYRLAGLDSEVVWTPVDGGVVLRPNDTVRLRPEEGVLVLMRTPFMRRGERFTLVLEFERSPELMVHVQVADVRVKR